MAVPFIVEAGNFGPRITVTGPWVPAIAEYMHREHVDELYLNQGRGWRGSTLSFLETVPALSSFSILDFRIEDVSAIQSLATLRALDVSTYCETTIDFSMFPNLERCVFYWRSGSESLFESSGLRSLFLHRYDGVSSEALSRLTGLEWLSVANSDIQEIEYLAILRNLKFLGLYNLRRLTSLRGLQCLTQLDVFELNGCKQVNRIDEVSDLVNLRQLQLNDDGLIASFAPLRALVALEQILFYESTDVADGDLAPLRALPRLRRVSFRNRRHYSHTRDNLLTR